MHTRMYPIGKGNYSARASANNPANGNIIGKIINPSLLPDTFVIFFDYNCPYSMNAIELLKSSNSRFKGYNINNINGSMRSLLNTLNSTKHYTNFDPRHRTKPIIFLNGQYVGGYDQLRELLYSNRQQN